MQFELFELWRTCKRGVDGYFSSRRAFLFVVIGMALLLFVGPSIFRWLREKAPTIMDSSIECIEAHLEKFQISNNYNDISVSKHYEEGGDKFLSYVGNGKIGLSINDNQMFLFYTRSLSLLSDFHPIVQVIIPGASSLEGSAVHFSEGMGYKFQCFNLKHGCLSVNHQIFAYRVIPSLLVQNIEIVNLSNEKRTINIGRDLESSVLRSGGKKQKDGSIFQYHLLSRTIKVPDSDKIIAYSVASSTIPSVIIVEPRSSMVLTIKTSIQYSKPISISEQEAVSKRNEDFVQQALLKVLGSSVTDLKTNHIEVWKRIWHSGFGISYSKAHGALNGDKINATLYYVLSNSREYLSEFTSTPQYLQSLQKQLYSPDKCYGGHHTLQASTLWSDLKTITDVNNVVSLWLLTLSKKGCHNLIQAGALGVMQSMVLSFGGIKFSNHHLEFDCDPKDLHRDYHFRRIIYGNSTHINISVIVQEDNKAVIYAALDRSDKDYYGCDAGCLDTPMKLGADPVQFPVKVTSPLTAILYITADKQHMEELKHTIHVAEVIEAPPHEHHIIALHRHGHQLGGLPVFFWVSIAFLIAVFHLFLIKLIFNEYCGNQEKPRRKYLMS